jgi:transcription initiation factor TFIID subunit 8
LNGPPNEQAKAFVPKHFPDFPSKHTYRSTAEFPDRESDPRRVRERATEEGRMGEEALRRLVGASSNTPAHDPSHKDRPKNARAMRHKMFVETMAAYAGDGEGMEVDGDPGCRGKRKQEEGDVNSMAGRLHSAVNAEKKYWRKPAQQRSGGIDGV